MIRLNFLGANQQVTGSRYLLEANGRQILIDCGLFQERAYAGRNWEEPSFAPSDLDLVLLTHAHLDHVGLIPRLVQQGYRGDILATPPSIDLADLVLRDAARIQEEDASYKKRRHQREGRRGAHPEVALYTVEEADTALRQFRAVQYGKPVDLGGGIEARYHDAGHILGSAMLEIRVPDGERVRTLVFSGDIGVWDRPLLHDPTILERADCVVMESTYGDRAHLDEGDVGEILERVVHDTVERGGNLLIPTFAIDRAQALMFFLSQLAHDKRIPRMTVFIDSPMAISATTIYKRYPNLLDDQARELLAEGRHPFQFPGLHFTRSGSESRSINSIRGSCIVLAGSGMCTGGRIKHHLRRNISRPESTILFVGYQAEGTLGRQISQGDDEVRIHGKQYPVRARIERLRGLSAHADRDGLLRWIGGFTPPPERLFLTHGELGPAERLRDVIEEERGVRAEIPEYGEVVEL